jgi:hypothetical protein
VSTALFKQINYPLATLIQNIEIGDIGLPDIQRPFVWTNTKVRDLFDSMYRGFPVGYLLFWENLANNGQRQIGTDIKQKYPRLLIVDGQQRLTSLYAVLKGIPILRENYAKERIYIAFRPRNQKFEVTDASIRKDPEFIPDISLLWSPETDIDDLKQTYIEKLRSTRALTPEEMKAYRQAVNSLYNLPGYSFTALELASSVDEEQVAEIFVRINSKGTPLNQADFILTLMSVFEDEERFKLERFCRDTRTPSSDSKPSPYNHFLYPDPDQLLRVSVGVGFRRARLEHVYSLLRGKDLTTGKFDDQRREQQFAILKQAQAYVLDLLPWHEFFKVLMRAGYRRANMITSKMSLLYTYTFFLIGRRDYQIDTASLRAAIARWFFMVTLTGRYTGSPETVMEQDLARLRSIGDGNSFIALLDRIVHDTLTEDFWDITLPNSLDVSAAQSPALFAYYAALHLLDARVLFSKMKVSELLDPAIHGKKAALERHHLFPRAYLKQLGITERLEVNQIANYALVEWPDNNKISDTPPAAYFPKFALEYTAEEMKCIHYWHALPVGWEAMAYHEFLALRRKGIARVIRDGFQHL